jgi:hypothetical protein
MMGLGLMMLATFSSALDLVGSLGFRLGGATLSTHSPQPPDRAEGSRR